MPGTPDEIVRLAVGEFYIDELSEIRWADGTTCTRQEWDDVLAVRGYHFRLLRHQQRDKRPQRRAMRTLRQFLTREQRRQLRTSRYFFVGTTRGVTYRLYPGIGLTQRVAKHGKNWFGTVNFCLHDDQSDPSQMMPPADLSLAHLLMLSADEEEFLTIANARAIRMDLWDGDYRRRLRQARIERELRSEQITIQETV